MTSPSPDDELLSVLLKNLRNAAATFGEGTPPYETIRTVIEDHLQTMKANGSKTNVTSVRNTQSATESISPDGPSQRHSPVTPISFTNLPFRPKPAS